MCVSFLTLIISISFYPLWSISKECLCCKKGFLTNFPLNLLAFEIPNYLRIFNDLPRSGYGYFLKLHIVLWKVVLKKTFVGDWHFENPIVEVTFRVKQKAFSQSMVLYVLKSLVTETDCSGFFFYDGLLRAGCRQSSVIITVQLLSFLIHLCQINLSWFCLKSRLAHQLVLLMLWITHLCTITHYILGVPAFQNQTLKVICTVSREIHGAVTLSAFNKI